MAQSIGGGIWQNDPGGLSVLSCTIADNSASVNSGTQSWGGGIYFYCGIGSITNCIVAGNSAANFPDVGSTIFTDGGNNLVGIYGDPKLTNGVNGNIVGSAQTPVDAKLGAMADNGGATMTHALLLGSPAIDAANNSSAPATDQRGEARVATADIGAFESAPNTAPAFTSDTTAMGMMDTAFTFNVSATDADDDDLTFSATDLPSWLTLNDNHDGTATLTGTPTYDNAGENEVALRVSDGHDHADLDATITVLIPRWQSDSNVLKVFGTEGNDDIHIWRRDNSLRMVRNEVTRDLTGITSIEVCGFDGDDAIVINTRDIPAYVLGGAGNDVLTGYDEDDNFVGGGGRDAIDTGGGDDRAAGMAGKDTILGGAGNDRLFGGEGNDRIVGQDGLDQFHDDGGDDVIFSRDLIAEVIADSGGSNTIDRDVLLDVLT
jgi:hypothetical protein